MKQVKALVLDCCYPDYFQGFSGETLAVSVSNDMTLADVREQALRDYWDSDLFHYDPIFDDASLDVMANQAIRGLFNDDLSAIAFPDLPNDFEGYLYIGLIAEGFDDE